MLVVVYAIAIHERDQTIGLSTGGSGCGFVTFWLGCTMVTTVHFNFIVKYSLRLVLHASSLVPRSPFLCVRKRAWGPWQLASMPDSLGALLTHPGLAMACESTLCHMI